MLLRETVSNVSNMVFDVEVALEQQLGAQLLPFSGMDKSGSAVCNVFAETRGHCPLEARCPFRHVAGEKTIVCKHWLRGLCKKGDQCEFLHEYDLSKMPECYFFSKYNACSNKECPFRHIDPESKIKDCPWYDRGFCRHGPHCKSRHRRRVMCLPYMCGLCVEGPKCKYSHPSFDIPAPDTTNASRKLFNSQIICHNCHEKGHKATFCPRLPFNQGFPGQLTPMGVPGGPPPQQGLRFPFGLRPIRPNAAAMLMSSQLEKKPLQEITCYKCGEKGHYANKCTKGALAFLSQSAHLAQEVRQRDELQAFASTGGIPIRQAPFKPVRSGEMMR